MTATLERTAATVDDGSTVDIPATSVDEAVKRIDAANRRLGRAGVTDRFTYTLEPYEDITRKDGITVVEPRVVLTLSAPTLSFGGWVFQAALDIIDGQAIVSTAPGADLSAWERPAAHHCDHCGLNRSRTHSYVVRHQGTGEVRQIGRSCLPLFLGMRPAGLWAMQWADDALSDLTEREGSSSPDAPRLWDGRQVLALATVLSDRGRSFVPRAAAGHGRMATADQVWAILAPPPREPAAVRAARLEAVEQSEQVDPADIDAVIASIAGMGDSDYTQNLAVLAGLDHIPSKHVNLWVSLVGVYFRHERRKEQVAALPELTGNYIAEVGEKITDVTGLIVTLTSFESDYGYPPKLVTVLVVHTDCGHLIKWKGTVPDEVDGQQLENRQRITIARGTVAEHDEYNGRPQTRIVRGKLARPAE
ncbi:MAG: hypothetical protein DI630_16480 [Gordonia sp. (in: high G+C Gram-positive bacteria)]|nr:MAG: hypothetical protein DI630_16480 [Gordonia sp. (in: high G+C Gram-positive bacteria)]